MSAWDISGAVVWGVLTISGWRDIGLLGGTPSGAKLIGMALVLTFTGLFFFCVARLFGAKL